MLAELPAVELLVADLTVAPDRALLAAEVTELMPPVIACVVFLATPFTADAMSFAPCREDDPLTIGPRMIGSCGLVASGTSGCGGVLSSGLTGSECETGVEPVGVVSVGAGSPRPCWLIAPFVPASGTGATVAACSPVLGSGPPTPYGFVTSSVPRARPTPAAARPLSNPVGTATRRFVPNAAGLGK